MRSIPRLLFSYSPKFLFFFLLCATARGDWRSELVPVDWHPPGADRPFSEKLIQDFSTSGYARGEKPLPHIEGPVFRVETFGAVADGVTDSTEAIQAAIEAAGKAGGGVVQFEAGTYAVSPRGQQCLLVHRDHTVLRGDPEGGTRLLNTTTGMRNKSILRFRSYSVKTGPEILLTEDITGPGRTLKLADVSGLKIGDWIRVQWDFTPEWIAQHHQEAYWTQEKHPPPALYHREVMAVDREENTIRIDIPVRYELRVRDRARVAAETGLLQECGLENILVGNLQHSGSEWGETDYNVEGTSAYEVHNAWAVDFRNTRDCWILGVESFLPEGNTAGCHILSNGILLSNSTRITIRNGLFQRPQYGGGGGNGYMLRLHDADECLVQEFTAEFSRHGLVLSGPGAAGNVFLDCVDRETRRATGSEGAYQTGGRSSDHHMHFSHSNLFDNCVVENSLFSASHRRTWGDVPHGLTAAHTVFWNTEGRGDRIPHCVESRQGVYGYVIGTRGTRPNVVTELKSEWDLSTFPVDHVEGVGKGETLEPRSLFRYQVERRRDLP